MFQMRLDIVSVCTCMRVYVYVCVCVCVCVVSLSLSLSLSPYTHTHACTHTHTLADGRGLSLGFQEFVMRCVVAIASTCILFSVIRIQRNREREQFLTTIRENGGQVNP
jgi:hypothetical protein